jgi:predicted regulator of Ras-like GTPase activity (Roadblock/LC7/MglB family)
VADEISRLSDELARDPSSMVFIQLAELLRQQGQPEVARKVAIKGLERHQHNVDAHDLLARIEVDRGELQKAFDEWDMVLRLDPSHTGAKKGMGFVSYKQGNLVDAERYLGEASEADPDDASIAKALSFVRQRLASPDDDGAARPRKRETLEMQRIAEEEGLRPSWSDGEGGRDARTLFADVIGDGEQTILLLDAAGLVMAGAYVSADGRDVAQEVGAELSGVSDEAQRAMRHLDLGEWNSIVFETDAAIVALGPAPNNGLIVVAAERATPLGFVRRLQERALAQARAWMGKSA